MHPQSRLEDFMRISGDLKIIGLSELNRGEGAGAPVTVPRQSSSRQEEENVMISDPHIDEESKIVYSKIARDVQETLSWVIPQIFDYMITQTNEYLVLRKFR